MVINLFMMKTLSNMIILLKLKNKLEASAFFQNLLILAKYGNSLEKFVIGLHSQDDFLVKEGVLKLKEIKENES